MNPPNEILPLLNSLANGIPIGKAKAGQECPSLPKTPMIVLLDDIQGKGPSAFDATKLFDEIDSLIIALPPAFGAGASAVAARARTGDRALFVQTNMETLAQWLALVSERRDLAKNFFLAGTGELSADAALMLKDIGALAAGSVN